MNRNFLFFILFFVVIYTLTSQGCSYGSELTEIKSKQNSLGCLKEEDLSNLVFFSDYDLDYDRKLYYNPKAREVIKRMDTGENLVRQSNVSVAFYEFRHLLKDMQPNDFYYMIMAYKLSSIGFFSLSQDAIMKVQDKEIWGQHIDFIRKYCFPKNQLKVTEEVFFAGLLSDIIYNNLTDESLVALEKNGNFLTNYDYAKYIRAQAYFAEKNYKEALVQINKAITDNPDNIFYKKLKAEILNASGQEKETLALIRQIQHTDIIFTDIQKETDKIKYHSLSKIEKDETKQKYYLAYYFYLNKDYQRAISELKLLMMKGDTNEASELLGTLYKVTNMPQEAKKLYSKQVAKNKKLSYPHKGLGDIYLAEKNYAEALSEYKQAYRYNKKDIETLAALAVVSSKLKDEKAAEKYADKLIKTFPLNYKALYIAARLKQDKGNIYLKSSISQNPLYSAGWLDLAQQALSTKDLTSAEEYINAAAYITQKDARYFYYKSILNTEKKEYKSALKDINRAETIVKEKAVNIKEEKNEQI